MSLFYHYPSTWTILILLALVVFQLKLSTGFVDLCTNSNRIVTCPQNTPNFVLTNASRTISNCKFIACPSLVIDGKSTVSLLNVVFYQPAAAANCLLVAPTASNVSLALTNVSFVENTGGASSFAINAFNTRVVGNGISFVSNSITNAGGGAGMLVDTSSSTLDSNGMVPYISFTNSNFTNNAVSPDSSGGAIYLASPCKLDITSSTFQLNYAGNFGGAIFAEVNNTLITIRGSSFSKNTAFQEGGAMTISGGALASIYQTSFDQNIGTNPGSSGGAISVQTYSCLPMLSNSSFTLNKASQGSAVNFQGPTDDTVNCPSYLADSYFAQNFVSSTGTLCVYNNVPLFVDNSVFLNNGGFYGASIFAMSNPVPRGVTVSRCSMTGESTSVFGGSIYLQDASLFVRNSTFRNCVVIGGEGGAIYAYSDNYPTTPMTLEVLGCVFDGNSVDNYGGAIEVFGTLSLFTLTDVVGSNCFATDGGFLSTLNLLPTNAPAMTVYANNLTLFNNLASSRGGDIKLDPNVTLILTNSNLMGSSAKEGGGIAAYGPTAYPTSIVNTAFSGQNAVSGAAIVIRQQQIFSMSNCSFDSTLSSLGSSILLDNSVTLSLSSCSFSNGQAYNSGGNILGQNNVMITLLNCLFSNGRSNFGAAISLSFSSSITITGGYFKNMKALSLGGAISLDSASMATVNSVSFIGSKAEKGGVVSVQGSSMFTGSGCVVVNATSSFFGGVAFVANQGSMFTCTGCSFTDPSAASLGSLAYSQNGLVNLSSISVVSTYPGSVGSSLFHLEKSATLNIMNFNVAGSLVALDGTFLNSLSGSMANIQGVNLINPSSTSSIGSIVNVIGGSVASFFNLTMVNAVSPKAFFVSESGSQLTCNQCRISYTAASSSNQYIFSGDQAGVQLNFIRSSVYGYAGTSVISLSNGATGQCSNSSINGSSTSLSPIWINGANFVGQDCIVFNNTVTGSLDSCVADPSTPVALGGAFFVTGATSLLTLRGRSILDSNVADYGGAIYARGKVVLSGPLLIRRNAAKYAGGAIYLDQSTSSLTITSDSTLLISDNQVVQRSNSNSSLAYISSNSNLTFASTQSSLIGSIYVQEPRTASALVSQKSLLSNVTFGGKASRLSCSVGQAAAIKLALATPAIPDFVVTAYDPFGSVAAVDPTQLVLVQVKVSQKNSSSSSTSSAVPLVGESIKSIVDASTGSVTFSGLSIVNKSPGSYIVTISPLDVTGSSSSATGNFSYFEIQYTDCNPDTEAFVPSVGCVTKAPISPIVRAITGVICGLLIVINLTGLFGLYAFRSYHLVKANSPFFMAAGSVGTVIGLASGFVPSPLATIGNASCSLVNSFSGLGFTIVFASISIKLYRIRAIFDQKITGSKKKGKNNNTVRLKTNVLQDNYLMRYLAAITFIMVVYQICWALFGGSVATSTYIPSLGIVSTDVCLNDTLFDNVMLAIKFFSTLTVSYMAYQIRNVPADYNEAKYIAFACYNWFVFGTLLALFAQFAVSSPNIVFILQAVSLVLSHGSSSFFLIIRKVWRCYVDPAGTKNRVNTTFGSNLSGLGMRNVNAAKVPMPAASVSVDSSSR